MAVLTGVFYNGILDGVTQDVEDPGLDGYTFDSDDLSTGLIYNQFLYQYIDEVHSRIYTYQLMQIDSSGVFHFYYKFVHSLTEEQVELVHFEALQDPQINNAISPSQNTVGPLGVTLRRFVGGIAPVDLGIVDRYETNNPCVSTVMTADIEIAKPVVTFSLRGAPANTPVVHFVGLTRVVNPSNCIFVGRITKTSNVTTDASGSKDRFDAFRKNARITSQWWVPTAPGKKFTNAVEAITWP